MERNDLMNKLILSPSPHVRDTATTTKIMLDVIIALVPAAVLSAVYFGLRALLVLAVCIGTAVLAEWAFEKICKRENTISDLSAVVTGLLLALNLPVTIPLWVAALGSIVAIIVAKQLFGGIGKNFANPAIVARIVLFLSFSGAMTDFASHGIVAVSGATPLASIEALPSYKELLLGLHGGAMGETCALALLAGGIYLLIRRVISWHTPVAFIGTVFVFTLILNLFGMEIDPVYHVLAGGLMLGAFFMATDYATTPPNPLGKLVFGIGCGIVTVMIRVWGNYPEGVSFAILLMNILTPYITKLTQKRVFGARKAGA